MKQIIITLIAWMTIVLNINATGQEGEILFWKGTNYQMLTCPLYDCHEFDNLGKKLEEEWSSTSLWRGYVGHWEIENGMLYLSSIWTEKAGNISPNDIPELRKYCKNGRVAATWFSDTLRVVSGSQIFYEHMGFNRCYEHEDFIAVKQGKVVSVKRVENKLIIKGKMDDQKELVQFLADLGKQLHQRYPEASGRIFARVQYSNFGLMMMPTDVDVTFPQKREEPPYPQMEREIKEKLANYILANQILPCYYINGKIKSPSWTLPIRLE
jgi:hypothetical protein